MINFVKFAGKLICTDQDTIIDATQECPEKYLKVVDNVVGILKPDVRRFPEIPVEFIQNYLDEFDFDGIDNIIYKYGDDIEDGLIETISNKLYDRSFNGSYNSIKSIILTVSLYIFIAVNSKNA